MAMVKVVLIGDDGSEQDEFTIECASDQEAAEVFADLDAYSDSLEEEEEAAEEEAG